MFYWTMVCCQKVSNPAGNMPAVVFGSELILIGYADSFSLVCGHLLVHVDSYVWLL